MVFVDIRRFYAGLDSHLHRNTITESQQKITVVEKD